MINGMQIKELEQIDQIIMVFFCVEGLACSFAISLLKAKIITKKQFRSIGKVFGKNK